jgi:predicted RNA-binding Zn-ribbon protein involved in translation (DUF1610 family)
VSIKVTCPSCNASLKTKDSLAGKRAKCPHCGNPIQIPGVAGEEVHEAEEVGEFDFGGLDPNQGEAVEGRKPCPMCGEMILEGAAKCRFCGEIFDPELKKQEKKKAKSSGGADDDNLSVGEWLLAIFCSGIGCIFGIVWMIQGKPKGLKMIGVSFLFVIIWNVLRAAIEVANKQN